jgi:hypothetical protein
MFNQFLVNWKKLFIDVKQTTFFQEVSIGWIPGQCQKQGKRDGILIF